MAGYDPGMVEALEYGVIAILGAVFSGGLVAGFLLGWALT